MSPRARVTKQPTASKKQSRRKKRPARAAVVAARREQQPGFPVVGIGASAGGLEAFTQLLSGLPTNTGMAFVLIQHLDPQHDSLLTQALSRATTMPVVQISDGMSSRAQSRLRHPAELRRRHPARHAHALAAQRPTRASRTCRSTSSSARSRPTVGNQAIGIVLSGTASDGTAGLKAIKAADGIALVQDPASAKFSGMPQSAIDAGVVDAALTPAEMANELARLARHPYLVRLLPRPSELKEDDTLRKIFAVVRNAVGVDYSEYKPATLERRLARRMALRNIDSRERYLKLLLGEPDEARFLYEDVLIHVTSFFRDPEVFEQIKKDVFPTIVANKAEGAPIRVWVAGCSTGEEVYSLAIALLEFLDDAARSRPIQIFGTRHQRQGDRLRPRRALLRRRAPRGQRRAAAALLHQGRARVPHQQVGARAVHLRAPRPGARSALLQARPGELPQRPHLLRPVAAEAHHRHLPLLPEPARLPPARPRPRASPASASSSPRPIAAARRSRARRGAAR